jgi:hypothetical protein
MAPRSGVVVAGINVLTWVFRRQNAAAAGDGLGAMIGFVSPRE